MSITTKTLPLIRLNGKGHRPWLWKEWSCGETNLLHVSGGFGGSILLTEALAPRTAPVFLL